MPSPHLQLVKWTFPAVALIIGFFWYKRRRVERADPGGFVNLNCNVTSDTKKVVKTSSDSGIQHIQESFDLTNHCTRQEESVCVPRKISESLDIPNRKSMSQSFPTQSFSVEPYDSNRVWYKDVESKCNMDIQLSINPSMSNNKIVADGVPTFDVDNNVDKITRVSKNLAKEKRRTSQCEIESSDRKNEASKCKIGSENEQLRKHSESVTETHRQNPCERDSANHSPISGVLEGSVTDEARSEGSTDSGKGGSINGGRKDNTVPTTYEFAMPQNLVGRLIGRYGNFLHTIRTNTGVNIVVNYNPNNRDQKICSMQGTEDGIAAALDMIREKFPEKKFPQVTLEDISVTQVVNQEVTWITELMQLSLVESVNNDITICYIMKPNWFFIQLPTHPSFPSLRYLDVAMTNSYNTTDPPPVPDELKKGMIFVAFLDNAWVRVCIENPDPLGKNHLVRMVDHGGYYICSNAQMRKIRSDYLGLPFQAIEVFLANAQPKNGIWDPQAYDVVSHICSGVVGQAQIEGYVDSNIYVNLYFNVQKYGVISLADELIARGYAEPVPLEGMTMETNCSAYKTLPLEDTITETSYPVYPKISPVSNFALE